MSSPIIDLCSFAKNAFREGRAAAFGSMRGMSLDSQCAHAAQLSPLEAVRAHLRAGFKIFPVFWLRFESGKLLFACGNPSSNAKPVSQEKTLPQLALSLKDFAAALSVSPSLVSHEF